MYIQGETKEVGRLAYIIIHVCEVLYHTRINYGFIWTIIVTCTFTGVKKHVIIVLVDSRVDLIHLSRGRAIHTRVCVRACIRRFVLLRHSAHYVMSRPFSHAGTRRNGIKLLSVRVFFVFVSSSVIPLSTRLTMIHKHRVAPTFRDGQIRGTRRGEREREIHLYPYLCTHEACVGNETNRRRHGAMFARKRK